MRHCCAPSRSDVHTPNRQFELPSRELSSSAAEVSGDGGTGVPSGVTIEI